MKKILFFIPTLSGGGAERVLVNLVNNLDSNKFDVTLLTLFNEGVNKKRLRINIKYHYIFNKVFRGNIHLLKLFKPEYLAGKFITNSYDIVVSYLQGPTTRIVSGISNENTTKINWIHSSLSKNELKKPYRSYNEFLKCYKAFDATIFVSNSAKDVFENETGLKNNHFVKYNTVETEKIKTESNLVIDEGEYFDPKKTNIITIGRLTTVKGYDRLLRIAKRLMKNRVSFHLYIIGEGPLKQKMENYISKNNLDSYVSILGFKENPYKYLKMADLFICSSYLEGFSTAVTESLIVGTPVITTLCSGMEELLGENNEYGIIVDNNEDKLYEGLVDLINNDNKLQYYKKQAMVRGDYFDTRRTVKEVENLLLKL